MTGWLDRVVGYADIDGHPGWMSSAVAVGGLWSFFLLFHISFRLIH